jgi:hypothetical protein
LKIRKKEKKFKEVKRMLHKLNISRIAGLGVFLVVLVGFMVSPGYAEYVIQTIPQDDQLREKGIMILCPPPGTFETGSGVANFDFAPCQDNFRILGTGFDGDIGDLIIVSWDADYHAEYKVDFRLNGVDTDPDSFECVILEKDVCNPKNRQFVVEEEATVVVDISDTFICKFRKAAGHPGVGVLDLYWVDLDFDESYIADHIFKVKATANGQSGAEIQDLCILGFPSCRGFECLDDQGRFTDNCSFDSDCTNFNKNENYYFPIFSDAIATVPTQFNLYADPLYPFASCKNAGIWQRNYYQSPGIQLPDCLF